MLTVTDIKRITKGKIVQGNTSTTMKGASIDSRTLRKKNIFIAIKGKKFNGHDFIRTAIRRGAIAVIVSQNITCREDVVVIRVEDTTKALGQIAAWHRQQFSIPVIAVTGSVGKTTTKELIASVLSSRYKVLKNIKTENNHFGVPLTLLRLNSTYDIVVLELGTSQRGDIRRLAKIAQPTTVVLTNIGETHLEGLQNPRGVFQEKIQIVSTMKPNGLIIFNGDDRILKTISQRKYKQNTISFGVGGDVNLKAQCIANRGNHQLAFQVRGHSFVIHSPARHNINNALAAICCGLHYKIRYNKMSGCLARFSFRNARQQIIKYRNFWLIDDTYNASPISLSSAIRTLNTMTIKGKRIVVCADMLELGSRSKSLHRRAGKMIAQSNTDVVLTIGPQARFITESLRSCSETIEARHCTDLKEVHRRLKSHLSSGNAVLVKGSRGMHMERTIAYLKSQFKKA